jgi:hypothetical protein
MCTQLLDVPKNHHTHQSSSLLNTIMSKLINQARSSRSAVRRESIERMRVDAPQYKMRDCVCPQLKFGSVRFGGVGVELRCRVPVFGTC